MCNMIFSLLKWSQLIMFNRLILAGYSSEDVNTCVSLGGFLMSSASAMSSALIVGWSRSQFSSEEQWKSSRSHHIELSTILFLVKPCEDKSLGFIFPGAMSPISFACQLTNLIYSVSDVLFPRLFISNPAKYGSWIYPINHLVNLLFKWFNDCRHKSCQNCCSE